MARRLLALLLLAPALAGGEIREGVNNGSFEDGLHQGGDRPKRWVVGFVGEPPTAAGDWRLEEDATDGVQALELRCESADDSFFVSQVLDLPGGTMDGVRVSLSLSARRLSGTGEAVALLFALNPEAPVDPDFDFPMAGKIALASTESAWTRLEGELDLGHPAEELAVVLAAAGQGARVRFDHVSVTADLPLPCCAPAPLDLGSIESGPPSFPLGIVSENPRNQSEVALEDLARQASMVADVVNLFAHIRWNALTGRPLLEGHDRTLSLGDELRAHGVSRMLTLDFTHDAPESVGDLNPLPDGTPVGRLDDPGVTDAYLDELEALVEAIDPTWVSVGIESDFFWQRHPDQWGTYRNMLCEAKTRLAGLHVTTYFTLPTLIRDDGSADQAGQTALRELLPCIDSVGYSTYFSDGTTHVDHLPPGIFTAASAVAPELPLILPEFGYRGGDGPYSEAEQRAVLLRVLAELDGQQVAAACWYSLYDQDYFGAPEWFQTWFNDIGLRHRDGTPKPAWTVFRTIHRSRREADDPLPEDEPCLQTRQLGPVNGADAPSVRRR